MSTPTDSHAATTPAPDVDADYGTMNRELLAEKLARAYLPWMRKADAFAGLSPRWLDVADVAIAELQGTPAP